MQLNNLKACILTALENLPNDWLSLTTHRLDIYNESEAKTEFIEALERLFKAEKVNKEKLKELPTAYDYIRLGHPLSSVLEWCIAKLNRISYENVISFSSQTMPIMAVLRQNALESKKTLLTYNSELPAAIDIERLKTVYGYDFETKKIDDVEATPQFEGSIIYVSEHNTIKEPNLNPSIDFYVHLYPQLGSVVIYNGEHNQKYISAIQHVRRRETIAMTPANALTALEAFVGNTLFESTNNTLNSDKSKVLKTITNITKAASTPLVGSSGLSIQYAIMMGLVEEAQTKHPNKPIKFLVPPNCYGGTNDQARRVAEHIKNVEILDLPVDGDNDMVRSLDQVLNTVAVADAVPYIIAEIPTNPRVEVPNLDELKSTLTKKRLTKNGEAAIAPVFILDQTFCPNVQFLGDKGILSKVKTISYVSGSKFPSGGKCTAGYCVANTEAKYLVKSIATHLQLCDNEATDLQYTILAEQMPSMLQRISEAYANTREFVSFIEATLPEAKINFVSKDLAQRGFTPSVFSLDLPTKGNTPEEKETHKRDLNHKLIKSMITEIPNESKYCVSYGQLKGCYWTIPATSTQGTTKEGDKDYIARVAVSPKLDLEQHKKVFKEFVSSLY